MKRALKLAQRGRGYTSPNPLVGAVIVKNGETVGEGYHRKVGEAHAEINALLEAGEKAWGSTLYVNLEPCAHYGRTPPCTESILKAGIRKVVIATLDPNPQVTGKGVESLRAGGVEVEVGLLEDEARHLNEVFFKYITTGRPFVVIKAALTLDGKVATRSGDARWVTGSKAREEVHRLRHYYDAVMVGSGTVLQDDPRLNCRLQGGKDPVRIVVDSHLRTPVRSRILNLESESPTIIATLEGCDRHRKRVLEENGAEILEVPRKGSGVDLKLLLEMLAYKEVTSVLVEAGPTLNASLFQEELVDKVLFFMAPKILGGVNSPGPVGGRGVETMGEALMLKKMKLRRYGQDFLFLGYPEKKG